MDILHISVSSAPNEYRWWEEPVISHSELGLTKFMFEMQVSYSEGPSPAKADSQAATDEGSVEEPSSSQQAAGAEVDDQA